MAIPVTTRSGKGSPLTQAEMDTNLTELARSATETEEGSIEIATQAETTDRSDTTKAVPPGYLDAMLQSWFEDNSSTGTGNPGYITFPNGFKVQWGRLTLQATGSVSLPVSFSNTDYSVTTTTNQAASATYERFAVTGRSEDSFNYAGRIAGPLLGYWIAVGF